MMPRAKCGFVSLISGALTIFAGEGSAAHISIASMANNIFDGSQPTLSLGPRPFSVPVRSWRRMGPILLVDVKCQTPVIG